MYKRQNSHGSLVTFGVKFLKADILVQTLFTPKGERYPKFICEGFNSKKELYRFTKWIKLDELPEECLIPDWLDGTLSPKHCNIEFVDGKVIEVHLRHSTDFPENATTIIPIWADSDQQDHHIWGDAGYTYVDNPDNADGNIENALELDFIIKQEIKMLEWDP